MARGKHETRKEENTICQRSYKGIEARFKRESGEQELDNKDPGLAWYRVFSRNVQLPKTFFFHYFSPFLNVLLSFAAVDGGLDTVSWCRFTEILMVCVLKYNGCSAVCKLSILHSNGKISSLEFTTMHCDS